MKKRQIISVFLLSFFVAFGAIPSADVETDFHKLTGNLRAYPYADIEPPAQTPPPTGYEPFHLEH